MKYQQRLVLTMVVGCLSLASLSGCTGNSYRDRQMMGAAGGAALGGIAGHAIGGSTTGTVIGGALGAGVGSAVTSNPNW